MNDLKRFEEDLLNRVDERYIKQYKGCKYRASNYYYNNKNECKNNKNKNYRKFLFFIIYILIYIKL
jgi:hypothetical protein